MKDWAPADALNHGEFQECKCLDCQHLCLNPGWFTPKEAETAIEEGYADKLMLDYYILKDSNIYILCPASNGCEKNRSKNTGELRFLSNKGRCTLQKEGMCTIHNTSFKPLQCRSAMGCKEGHGLDGLQMAKKWDNQKARDLIKKWMALVDLDESVMHECW